MTKRQRGKKRFKRWVWILVAILSGCCLFFAEIAFFKWNDDNKKINKQVDEINKKVKVEMEDSTSSEKVNPPDDKTSDYWSYMNLPLLSVDFNELLKKNEDTVAFIKVNGTKINYPIVQTRNNDFYLNHAFDKSKNDAGWVFLDYRNDMNNLQDNTIIYAHGRVDTTMFGSLKNVLKKSWYRDLENRIIYLSTPHDNMMWQIFSTYVIKTETYYLTSSFGSDESKREFIDKVLKRSIYEFDANVTVEDKLLTLSTCYNDKEKLVLHAKLIKKQSR